MPVANVQIPEFTAEIVWQAIHFWRALVFSRHAAEDIIRCMSSGIFPSVPEHPYTLDYSGAPLPANIREDIKISCSEPISWCRMKAE